MSNGELLKKILETLHQNTASFVIMLQVDPECEGECHWGGNYEACSNMSKRVEEGFLETLEDNTEEEEEDTDEPWQESE